MENVVDRITATQGDAAGDHTLKSRKKSPQNAGSNN